MIEYSSLPQSQRQRAYANLAAALKCSGMAAPYDQLSHPDEYGYQWQFAPGCFYRAASEPCKLWVCHRGRIELANTENGTLKLWEDFSGLHVEFHLPANQDGYDARLAIGRGEIRGLSVGMKPDSIVERYVRESGRNVRIIERASLREISLATSPRFPQTQINAASYRDQRDADEQFRINRFLSFV